MTGPVSGDLRTSARHQEPQEGPCEGLEPDLFWNGGDAPALEVVVRWGDCILDVVHLSPPREFVVGEGGDCDFRVAAEAAGASRVAVPARGGRHRVGVLDVEVRPTRVPARRVAPLGPPSAREHAWSLASLGVHMLFVGLVGLLPPRTSMFSNDLTHVRDRYLPFTLTGASIEDPPIWIEDRGAGEDGKAARDESGKMGDPDSAVTHRGYRTKGPPDNPDPALKKALSDREMKALLEGSAIGVLRKAATLDEPTSPYSRDNAQGKDPLSALGALLGAQPGLDFGHGGLGMKGTGRGGGGDAAGSVGTHELGTLGRGPGRGGKTAGEGPGYGEAAGSFRRRQGSVPRVRVLPLDVSGSLSRETIRRVIRRQLSQVRYCYEQHLNARPDLAGRIVVKFIIDATGVVRTAAVAKSDLGHAATEQCIAAVMRRLSFPAPSGGGVVVVSYPFLLESN